MVKLLGSEFGGHGARRPQSRGRCPRRQTMRPADWAAHRQQTSSWDARCRCGRHDWRARQSAGCSSAPLACRTMDGSVARGGQGLRHIFDCGVGHGEPQQVAVEPLQSRGWQPRHPLCGPLGQPCAGMRVRGGTMISAIGIAMRPEATSPSAGQRAGTDKGNGFYLIHDCRVARRIVYFVYSVGMTNASRKTSRQNSGEEIRAHSKKSA